LRDNISVPLKHSVWVLFSPSLFNRSYIQDIRSIDIGLVELQGPTPLGWFLTIEKSSEFIKSLKPKHLKHDHKGTRGHALIIGGNMGMHGAVCMSAKMASKVGAGNDNYLQSNKYPTLHYNDA